MRIDKRRQTIPIKKGMIKESLTALEKEEKKGMRPKNPSLAQKKMYTKKYRSAQKKMYTKKYKLRQDKTKNTTNNAK